MKLIFGLFFAFLLLWQINAKSLKEFEEELEDEEFLLWDKVVSFFGGGKKSERQNTVNPPKKAYPGKAKTAPIPPKAITAKQPTPPAAKSAKIEKVTPKLPEITKEAKAIPQ